MLRVQIPPLPKQPAATPAPIAPATPVADKQDDWLSYRVMEALSRFSMRLSSIEFLLIANLSVSAITLSACAYLVLR